MVPFVSRRRFQIADLRFQIAVFAPLDQQIFNLKSEI
jgi:hypothetical protein